MKTISLLFTISLFINGVVTDEIKVGDGLSVTLHTNTVIQSNDVIEWRHRNELIAKLDRGSISVFNGSDGTFSDKLKINNQTGDLTIIDVTYKLNGEYRLQITGEKTTRKTFSDSVRIGYGSDMTSLAVMEGDSVILFTGFSENHDVIRWRFQNSPLAEISIKTKIISTHDDVHDGRFRDRLKLNYLSGYLTITNITTEDSGLYEVNINSNSGTHTIHQSYTVTVSDQVKTLSVMEGDSLNLHVDTPVQSYDFINWTFGPEKNPIVVINGGEFKLFSHRFRDRVQVNAQTGSLTITNITTEDPGLYQLQITNHQSKRSIDERFIVTVSTQDRSSDDVSSDVSSDLLNQEHKRITTEENIQWT
ncbi:hypothetical protein IRJ41_000897 [Triplophysa rosa]|uniref:Immunoglobulin domain-containing protein n=1 Tax=Triplophysa rosa TaxID=992332 RepID=A0A9W7T666_TRIRA|nr:hypothetical protein IRJ41_000897 [Triplophysa rosa]